MHVVKATGGSVSQLEKNHDVDSFSTFYFAANAANFAGACTTAVRFRPMLFPKMTLGVGWPSRFGCLPAAPPTGATAGGRQANHGRVGWPAQ